MIEKHKLELISFAQTFGALFVLNVAFSISQIPLDQILSGEVMTSSVLLGLISAAGRSAFKLAWQKVMPVKLGGK